MADEDEADHERESADFTPAEKAEKDDEKDEDEKESTDFEPVEDEDEETDDG